MFFQRKLSIENFITTITTDRNFGVFLFSVFFHQFSGEKELWTKCAWKTSEIFNKSPTEIFIFCSFFSIFIRQIQLFGIFISSSLLSLSSVSFSLRLEQGCLFKPNLLPNFLWHFSQSNNRGSL